MTLPHDTSILAHITPGMRVVDSAGEAVGTVEELKMGDPEAITSEGQDGGSGYPLADAVADTISPDLPASVRSRLLRTGYVKVDAKGLFARDFYVGADDVEAVEADVVRLAEDAGRFEAK
jgi:hypothetical protein